ncbi:AP-2 complex subunit sigma, partial [Lachnellula arida]
MHKEYSLQQHQNCTYAENTRPPYNLTTPPSTTFNTNDIHANFPGVHRQHGPLLHPNPKPAVHRLVAPRDQKYQSNFVEFRQNKIVYRRYAGLFFCACVDANDNELAFLEAIHFFVEVLDSFFGNVCELDLVFNFYK